MGIQVFPLAGNLGVQGSEPSLGIVPDTPEPQSVQKL
jgi:hypothetical protein